VKLPQGVAAALAVALLAGCTHAPPTAATPAAPTAAAADLVIPLGNFDPALLARAIFRETNRVRAAHGVASLAPLASLDTAADQQATYMALALRAQHDNPIPFEHDVLDRVTHLGLHPTHVAENAIMMPAQRPPGEPIRDYTYTEMAARLVEGWMNSPGHRVNLLDPRVTHLGCAARLAHGIGQGDQRIFAVQVFFLPYPEF
jgi:uncharacterized protein YkwD